MGERVYGDTYAGYAELAVLSTDRQPLVARRRSRSPTTCPPIARSSSSRSPTACTPSTTRPGSSAGDRVIVLGAGQMGLQLAAVARRSQAPTCTWSSRTRSAAATLGARRSARLGRGGLAEAGAHGAPASADGVVLSIGDPDLVAPCIDALAPGGRVVLFAGFGDRAEATLDINRIHYQEIAVVGSEWIGDAADQRRERYAEAPGLLAGDARARAPGHAHCDLDGIAGRVRGVSGAARP